MKTKTPKRYGYDRRSKVPSLGGATPRVCRRCDLWFASHPREAICDGCVRPSERARRANGRVASAYTKTPSSLSKRAGRRQVTDPLALCMELAHELAEKIDYPKGNAPKPMPLAVKRYYIRRAVNLGLQGACDLV